MIRFLFPVLCCTLLLISCSKRERSDPNSEEWADIQALADDQVATAVEGGERPESGVVTNGVAVKSVPKPSAKVVVDDEKFAEFAQRLEAMRSIDRGVGETMLTGETLVFDYEQRYVRMNKDVVVVDDQGRFTSDSLVGRFTISNEVDFVEAKGHVDVVSGDRKVSSDEAVYSYQDGFILLSGNASASDATNSISGDRIKVYLSTANDVTGAEASGSVKISSGNRQAFGEDVYYDGIVGSVKLKGRAYVTDGTNSISGERIQAWIRAHRKVICEPNVLLELSGSSFEMDGVSTGANENTEIRGGRLEFDEEKRVAELSGNVRIRDPRAAMNCGDVRIYLKDANEIDWIEAVNEVIIQSDDRKALAERATYHVDESKFTLEGAPKVQQGLHVMTGDRIMFWHNDRRMVCEPNARILLHLDEETKAKFLKDLDE